MRELRKLRKLIRSPRRFVEDSRVYRRARELAGVAPGPLFRPPVHLGRALRDVGVGGALFEALANDLSRTIPTIDLSLPNGNVLAVRDTDVGCLTSWLAALRNEGEFEVTIGTSGGGITNPKLFQIDELFAKRPFAEVVVTGRGESVKIEFQLWESDEKQIVGPKPHPLARRISHHTCEEHGLFTIGRVAHVRILCDEPPAELVNFPIDVVYTWVSHADPTWQRLWHDSMGHSLSSRDDDAKSLERYLNRDELRFSLRSIDKYAPWVRNVYVVSNCAPPDWVDQEQVRWVDHREIIDESSLPTFSSHAIEASLHHIDGLSNHFLYFNDDFFLTRSLDPEHFFLGSGLSRSFFEGYATVNGSPTAGDPDYLNAARNGRRLIERDFGRSPLCLHKHTPYALRRDVLAEMEERYSAEYARTVRSRVRSITDLSTVSFLYHHYACLTGRAVSSGREVFLAKPQSADYLERMSAMLAGKKVPVTLCLNDGSGSASYPHWGTHVVEFLSTYFPEASRYETATETKE